jgi:hypothetical protein
VKEIIDSRILCIEQSIMEDRHYDTILCMTEHDAQRVLSVEQCIDFLTSEVKYLSSMIIQQIQNTTTPVCRTVGLIGHMTSPTHSSGGHSHTTSNSMGSTTTALHNSSFHYEQMHIYLLGEIDRHCHSMVPIIPPNIHRSILENMEYWLNHKYWEFLLHGDTSLRQLG